MPVRAARVRRRCRLKQPWGRAVCQCCVPSFVTTPSISSCYEEHSSVWWLHSATQLQLQQQALRRYRARRLAAHPAQPGLSYHLVIVASHFDSSYHQAWPHLFSQNARGRAESKFAAWAIWYCVPAGVLKQALVQQRCSKSLGTQVGLTLTATRFAADVVY